MLTDRWDAWGEPLEHRPPTPFAHLVIIGSSEEHDTIVNVVADALCGDGEGTHIAVETRIDDWSIDEVGGRIWHRVGTREDPAIFVEVHPWTAS